MSSDANFTMIPNSIIELMSELTETEFKVVLCIYRKTAGYHKDSDRISYTQLQKLTGMSRASVKRAVTGDNLKKVFRVERSRKGNVFHLIKTPNKENEDRVKSEPQETKTGNAYNEDRVKYTPTNGQVGSNLAHTRVKSEPTGRVKSEHTKENYTKENKQKKEARLLRLIENDLSQVQELEQQLTQDECKKLVDNFGFDTVEDVLLSMENHKSLKKKYKSVYLTALNWCKMRQKEKPEKEHKIPIV